MSGLVGYESSDEEEDIRPEKPAKILKLDSAAPQTDSIPTQAYLDESDQEYLTAREGPPGTTKATQSAASTALPSVERPGPAPVLVGVDQPTAAAPILDDPSLSPYTFERQRLRELTMPTTPNFDIPNSPSSPPTNSEEAAALAARTKKFERFLELKKQGVHFNERLHTSASLRNPSLLPKLMEFAGISIEASYASTLPEDMGVPVRWPEEVYVEGLLKASERGEKKRKAERDKVDFVPAASSAKSTPATKDHRKSRYERK